MTLSNWMTTTASTTRLPAISSGKIGDPVTNLTGLKIVPLQFPTERGANANSVRPISGLEGTAVFTHITFTQAHAHTDSGTPVTGMPDIVIGDRLVVGSTTYTVKMVMPHAAGTVMSAHLELRLDEDKRA